MALERVDDAVDGLLIVHGLWFDDEKVKRSEAARYQTDTIKVLAGICISEKRSLVPRDTWLGHTMLNAAKVLREYPLGAQYGDLIEMGVAIAALEQLPRAPEAMVVKLSPPTSTG